ncbi:alpha/beta hydrolase [Staphylococcus ursi]|nr:alpha/beta hydrolase [Staphylococcus sp. MI 10-1553]
MKKKWIWGATVLIVVLIVGLFVAVSFNHHQANSKNYYNTKLVKSQTPTLFLHGYDGSVSNSSSKSLKYLLGDSPKSYKESKYEGKTAQYSELHENSDVADELTYFLWSES